jgi:hypothetical protein
MGNRGNPAGSDPFNRITEEIIMAAVVDAPKAGDIVAVGPSSQGSFANFSVKDFVGMRKSVRSAMPLWIPIDSRHCVNFINKDFAKKLVKMNI